MNGTRGVKLVSLAIALLLLALGGALLAQEGDGYALRWWSADGGGDTLSRAGDYVLGGTAGQADAGLLAGEAYTLRGGFWGGAFRESAPPLYRVALPIVARNVGGD